MPKSKSSVTPKTRQLVARVRKGGSPPSPRPRRVDHQDDLRRATGKE